MVKGHLKNTIIMLMISSYAAYVVQLFCDKIFHAKVFLCNYTKQKLFYTTALLGYLDLLQHW